MINESTINFTDTIFPGEKHLARAPGYLGQSSLIGGYNLPANFKALHFVVLPVNIENEFTWAMRRGTGYQYGYLLEKPITDFQSAEYLVQRLCDYYDAVFDLPNSYGWSPGQHTILESWLPGNRWTLPDLLHGVPELNTGTNAYREKHYSINGIIDEVLEWLVDQDRVIKLSPGGFKITCPWEREHFSKSYAGYRPFFRKFFCNDESCAGRTVTHFLEEVFLQGGPAAPVKDVVGLALAKWAWTPGYWLNLHRGVLVKDRAMRGLLGQSVRLPVAFGRWHSERLYDVVSRHDRLLRVIDTVNDESGPAVVDAAGVLAVNLYQCKGSKVDKPDDLSRLIDTCLDFADRNFSGVVQPDDLLFVFRQVIEQTRILKQDGAGWRTRGLRLIRARTQSFSPPFAAWHDGRTVSFRHTLSGTGFDTGVFLAAKSARDLRKRYPSSAKNAIIDHVKQWLAGENPDFDK